MANLIYNSVACSHALTQASAHTDNYKFIIFMYTHKGTCACLVFLHAAYIYTFISTYIGYMVDHLFPTCACPNIEILAQAIFSVWLDC